MTRTHFHCWFPVSVTKSLFCKCYYLRFLCISKHSCTIDLIFSKKVLSKNSPDLLVLKVVISSVTYLGNSSYLSVYPAGVGRQQGGRSALEWMDEETLLLPYKRPELGQLSPPTNGHGNFLWISAEKSSWEISLALLLFLKVGYLCCFHQSHCLNGSQFFV